MESLPKNSTFWSYADPADKGFGLFKKRVFSALEHFGRNIRLARAPLADPSSKKILRDDLIKTNPDWIFLINQSAGQFYEYLELDESQRPYDAKKLVWYLDNPRFFIDRSFEENEHVLSFDPTYLDVIASHSPGVCGFWPLAADQSEAGSIRDEFRCDVCFVGGVIDQSARRSQLPPAMQAYVDQLVECKLDERSKDFDQLAEENPIEEGKRIHIQPQVAHYLYWEANNRYRIRLLESLTDFDLRVYGNPDWEILLKDSPLKERFYGAIDPVNELPHMFASAKINLNIHSVQCMGSLNQRDFNAPVAGGFLLSDWVPAAADYFEPGSEAVYWNSVDDMRNKINYYLQRPDERAAIMRRGAMRVQNDHTYLSRVSELLKTVLL